MVRVVEWVEEGPKVLGTVGQLSEADVLGLQVQMNIDNRCIGSPRARIDEDGIPGSETCAMAEFLNTRTGTAHDPSLCPGAGSVSAYPAEELCALAAKPPPAPPSPPPGEEEDDGAVTASMVKTKKGGGIDWPWLVAGVATVAIGVVLLK